MGLLDFYDDPAANMALAAGLLSGGNFGTALGKGMAGAQALMDSKDERKRRNEYMQAQAENLRNEIAKRNFDMEKSTRLQSLLDKAMGAAPASGVAISNAPAAQGGSPSMFDPQMLAALKINGVDLVDVAKLAKPEWQNINGYLVNTNDPSFKGGFQPGMNTASNGQVTAWMPDGNGGFVVGAPKGALETYKAYQNAGKQAENANTLAPLDRIDPATNRPYAATVDQLIRQVQPEQALRQQTQGGMGNTSSDYAREIAQTRASLQNPNLDPASRKMLEDHLTVTMAQAQRSVPDLAVTPSRSTGFNGFAGPADTARAVKQAEADVSPTMQKQNAMAAAMEMNSVINKAMNHPGRETATGLSGTLDPRNYIPGTNAKDFAALNGQLQGGVFLQAYQTLKGGGQITEIEGKKAEKAIARLQTSQSDKAYKEALQDLQSVVQNSMARMKGQGYTDPPTANGQPEQAKKRATLADIAETARKSGKSTAEVTARLKELGYEIGGN